MRYKSVLKDGEHRGFKKGISMVPFGVLPDVRNELHAIIGGTRCKVNYYMTGKTIIRKEMAGQIEDLFARFGIEDNIFDE